MTLLPTNAGRSMHQRLAMVEVCREEERDTSLQRASLHGISPENGEERHSASASMDKRQTARNCAKRGRATSLWPGLPHKMYDVFAPCVRTSRAHITSSGARTLAVGFQPPTRPARRLHPSPSGDGRRPSPLRRGSLLGWVRR
jgi:hypothetical protein